MKTDDVNPMTEMERLFEERSRQRTQVAEIESKIFRIQDQLDKEKASLEIAQKAVSLTEHRIKEQAKNLNV